MNCVEQTVTRRLHKEHREAKRSVSSSENRRDVATYLCCCIGTLNRMACSDGVKHYVFRNKAQYFVSYVLMAAF